jgi:hypothetical protein
MISTSDFFHFDLPTGNSKTAKPKTVSTTYPASPTYNNPGQITFKLSDQPDVRTYAQKKIGAIAMGDSQMWANGFHITESQATGSPITQVIQQEDQTFIAEAQRNSNPLQMMHRLRTELNTTDFNGFIPKANTGLMQTFQSLLSGSGIGNIPGMSTNLLSAFTSIGSAATSTGQTQNEALANNSILNSNLDPINANGQVITV